MTMFDDQPNARDVLTQRKARLEEDVQHASSAADCSPSHDGALSTACSPSTPGQRPQDMNELGIPASRASLSKAGSSSARWAAQCKPINAPFS